MTPWGHPVWALQAWQGAWNKASSYFRCTTTALMAEFYTTCNTQINEQPIKARVVWYYHPKYLHGDVECSRSYPCMVRMRARAVDLFSGSWRLEPNKQAIVAVTTTAEWNFCNTGILYQNTKTAGEFVFVFHLTMRSSEIRGWRWLCGDLGAAILNPSVAELRSQRAFAFR